MSLLIKDASFHDSPQSLKTGLPMTPLLKPLNISDSEWQGCCVSVLSLFVCGGGGLESFRCQMGSASLTSQKQGKRFYGQGFYIFVCTDLVIMSDKIFL